MMGFIWFWLVAVMIVGYVVLDGFDSGRGCASPFPGAHRSRAPRHAGKHWPGVGRQRSLAAGRRRNALLRLSASVRLSVQWVLSAADDCALAARPARRKPGTAQSHRRRGLARTAGWRLWTLQARLLAVFFGAALANVLRGVPLQADGYFFLPLWTNWQPGIHPGILDWYTVIGGVLALVALTLHGALWLTIKTSGELAQRARRIVDPLWLVLASLTIISLVATITVRPAGLNNYFNYPFTFVIPAGVAASHGRHLDFELQGPTCQSLPRFLPLSVLYAGRRLLEPLSHTSARFNRLRPRHHSRQGNLWPAHPSCGSGLVELRHGAGGRLRGFRVQQVSRKS